MNMIHSLQKQPALLSYNLLIYTYMYIIYMEFTFLSAYFNDVSHTCTVLQRLPLSIIPKRKLKLIYS